MSTPTAPHHRRSRGEGQRGNASPPNFETYMWIAKFLKHCCTRSSWFCRKQSSLLTFVPDYSNSVIVMSQWLFGSFRLLRWTNWTMSLEISTFQTSRNEKNTLFFCSNEYATSKCADMVISSFLGTISRWLVHTAIREARRAQGVMPPYKFRCLKVIDKWLFLICIVYISLRCHPYAVFYPRANASLLRHKDYFRR